MNRIERICGWCGASMGTKPCSPGQGCQPTHGMCDPCKEKWDRDLEAAKAKRGTK